jgi:hypothetical protein
MQKYEYAITSYLLVTKFKERDVFKKLTAAQLYTKFVPFVYPLIRIFGPKRHGVTETGDTYIMGSRVCDMNGRDKKYIDPKKI